MDKFWIALIFALSITACKKNNDHTNSNEQVISGETEKVLADPYISLPQITNDTVPPVNFKNSEAREASKKLYKLLAEYSTAVRAGDKTKGHELQKEMDKAVEEAKTAGKALSDKERTKYEKFINTIEQKARVVAEKL